MLRNAADDRLVPPSNTRPTPRRPVASSGPRHHQAGPALRRQALEPHLLGRSAHGPSVGETFETPVAARRVPGGFVVALAFGSDAHWHQNLHAAGGGVIRWRGIDHPVGVPERIGVDEALGDVPADPAHRAQSGGYRRVHPSAGRAGIGASQVTWRVEDRLDGRASPRTFVIEDSLGYLINRAARAFANRLGSELRQFDVGTGQWAVLMHLWANDGMTQAQLARRVAIEQPTMVRTIDRMERDGLVTRTPDPNDRRASRITLTERGWALRDQLVPLAAGVNRSATAALTDDEVAALRRLLSKLVAADAGTLSP